MTAKTDQVSDTWNLQYLQPVTKRDAHKDIARKQGHLKPHSTVFPSPHGIVQRKQVLDGPLFQLLGHTLLMIRIGVNGVPQRLKKPRGYVWIAFMIRCVHSRGCHAV